MGSLNSRIFKSLLLIFLSVGLIWIRSSYGKLSSANFADSLGKVLQKSAQSSPYPFYQEFLISFAIPNSYLFGLLVMWGEFLVAIAITLSCVYLLWKNPNERVAILALVSGLMGGIFLNINFWLAFSSGNAGADNLNLLMIGIQGVGLYCFWGIIRQWKK